MADTRFLTNKRLAVATALVSGNPFVNPAAPTVTEANALKNVSAAIRLNGYTFGMQKSAQNNDRSLVDDAAAQIRGFNAFGGDMPAYVPSNYADTTDILQQFFTLVKAQGVGLWIMTRLGPVNTTPFAAGDFVNVYQVLTDGYENQTTGVLGAVAMITFLPQGNVYADQILAPAAPVAITVSGIPAAPSIATNKIIWGTATYQGLNVTQDCTWTSSDTTKATPTGTNGMFILSATGAATITASYPGATSSTPFAITIAA